MMSPEERFLALKPMGYEVINLGSDDDPIELDDAIRLVEELLEKKAALVYRPRHPADVRATWVDISKTKQLLGWQPQILFQRGIEGLVSWYQENREWAKNIST
jgi:UDP-glucuronate 4-epimerase